MKSIQNADWNNIKDLLCERLNIPTYVLDFIAIRDILLLCASGSSNTSIARITELDYRYIQETIQEFYFFDGWKDDIDFNPYNLFYSCFINNYGYKEFEQEINILYPFYPELEIQKMYLVAYKYTELEQEMEKFWI